jgi:hypothetical protein
MPLVEMYDAGRRPSTRARPSRVACGTLAAPIRKIEPLLKACVAQYDAGVTPRD